MKKKVLISLLSIVAIFLVAGGVFLGRQWKKPLGTSLGLFTPAVSYTHLDVYKRQAMGLGSLVGSLLGIWFARDYFTREVQDIYQTWRENWRFGRWILGASLAEWVVVDFYPIIIAGAISFAATGAYQTLQNLSLIHI